MVSAGADSFDLVLAEVGCALGHGLTALRAEEDADGMGLGYQLSSSRGLSGHARSNTAVGRRAGKHGTGARRSSERRLALANARSAAPRGAWRALRASAALGGLADSTPCCGIRGEAQAPREWGRPGADTRRYALARRSPQPTGARIPRRPGALAIPNSPRRASRLPSRRAAQAGRAAYACNGRLAWSV